MFRASLVHTTTSPRPTPIRANSGIRVYRPLAMPHHRLSSRSPNASVPRQPRNIIAWRPTDPWACHSGQPPLSAPLSSFSLACRRPGTSSSKQSVIESNRPGIPGWECELARLLLADNDHEVVEQANPLFPSHLASSLAHRRDGVTQGAGSVKGIVLLIAGRDNCRGGCVQNSGTPSTFPFARPVCPILHDESWSIRGRPLPSVVASACWLASCHD